MRTNIVIDDDLIHKAMELSNIKTKKDVVEESLKLFVRLKTQESIKSFRGKLKHIDNLNETRLDKK